MMRNILFFSIFAFYTTAVFAQDEQRNAEVSELAKQYAEALCNCPVQDFIEASGNDFKANKISMEEFQET